MTDLLLDLRQTARALARDRAFTTIAVVLLALGIAANATIFSVLDAALLQPLPYAEGDALVHVGEVSPDGHDAVASQPNYLDFRAQQRTLTDLAAFRNAAIIYSGGEEPTRLEGAAVSASFFDVLGVAPIVGRPFLAREDAAGAPAAVVVISEGFWRTRLNAAADAVGSVITLNGVPHTITGVMPESFALPSADVWLPLGATMAADRDDHWLEMIGRLRPGMDVNAAQADLAAISARIGAEHPEVRGWGVRVQPLEHVLIGETVGRAVWMLMAAVALLLLLACANVANLFIARATARRGELAVRAALGAGRRRIIRQLLTEAALLSAAGAAAAVLLCTWGLYAVRVLAGDRIRGLDAVQLDGRAVAFTILLSVLVTFVFGLMPAWRSGRVDLQHVLKHGARGGAEREGRRTREMLVVAQVALAIVLLLGSGLLLRSYLQLRVVDPGFATANVHAVPLEMTPATYDEYWQVSVFYRELPKRIAQIPGVLAAGASTTRPFSQWRFVNDVTPVERAAEVGAAGLVQADWRSVSNGYFDAVQVPLLQGRLFEATDTYEDPQVAVITKSLADRLWPDRSAVGRQLYWGGVDGDPIEVVGVVGDIRDFELAAPAPPLMFLSVQQTAMPNMTVLVRTRGEVPGLADAIREAVWSINPAVPVPQVERVDRYRSDAMATPRMYATLLTTFALLALIVATLGVYALVSYQVASRARELGIRHALGAQPRALHLLILRRSGFLIGAGAVAGILLMLALGRFIRALLYETAATDPVTYVALPALLVVVALAAAYVPARRTTAVDPLMVLRSD